MNDVTRQERQERAAKVDALIENWVWIFNGGGSFPSAVFATIERAESWIAQHKLSGVLTKYPVDVGVWDWCVERGSFKVKRPDQESPSFIGGFSAGEEHYHYENGLGGR